MHVPLPHTHRQVEPGRNVLSVSAGHPSHLPPHNAALASSPSSCWHLFHPGSAISVIQHRRSSRCKQVKGQPALILQVDGLEWSRVTRSRGSHVHDKHGFDGKFQIHACSPQGCLRQGDRLWCFKVTVPNRKGSQAFGHLYATFLSLKWGKWSHVGNLLHPCESDKNVHGNARWKWSIFHAERLIFTQTVKQITQRSGRNKTTDAPFFITLPSSISVMSLASSGEHLSVMSNARAVDNRHHNNLWCMATITLHYYICSSGNLICFQCIWKFPVCATTRFWLCFRKSQRSMLGRAAEPKGHRAPFQWQINDKLPANMAVLFSFFKQMFRLWNLELFPPKWTVLQREADKQLKQQRQRLSAEPAGCPLHAKAQHSDSLTRDEVGIFHWAAG